MLLLFEAVIRIFIPQNLFNNQTIIQEDPVVEKRLIPNSMFEFKTTEFSYTVHTNSIGFRDSKHTVGKPSGVKRILILGDSFTYGPGIEQNKLYPKLLENLLNNTTSRFTYETLTMACGGYGVEHYLAILENIGLQYEPDLVILAIYVDNDVTDRLVIGAEEAKSERSFKNDFLYPINNWLEERSHAFVFVRERLDYPLWKVGLRPYYFPQVFWKDIPLHLKNDWQRTFNVLKTMQRLCDKEKILVVAFLIPTCYQVHEEIWKKFISVYDIDLSKVDLELPQKLYSDFFQQNDFYYLDLLDEFRKMALESLLYFPIDRHWNELGHELCTEMLLERISETARIKAHLGL